jgi:hypothetical protein
MIHGTYIGPQNALAGRTALLMYSKGGVLAQFDNRSTPGGLAYGWHRFATSDFRADPSDLQPAPTKG